MKNKKTTTNIISLIFIVFFVLLATLMISQLGINFSKKFKNELKEEQAQLLHRKENEELKELTLKISPNQKKQAYFQKKFTEDNVTDISDEDYISVILDQESKKEVLFQGNFRLSYLEWLNDNEIKVYKGCGSSCLLSYVVNIKTKEVDELVEKIIEHAP